MEPASTDARDHIGGKPRRRYGGVEAAGALAGAGLGAGGGAPTHSASIASSRALEVRATLSSGISAVMVSSHTLIPKTCHFVPKPPS